MNSWSQPSAVRKVAEHLRFDSAFWRQFMLAGIKHGPEGFVKHSPPIFGLAFGAALPKMRNRVRNNLQFILGPRSSTQEVLDVAAVFANYAHCLTEAMLLGVDRGYQVKPRVVGVEHFDKCVAQKKGMIVATAHTGGWDIAGAMLKRDRNQQVVTVMARERDTKARALQDEMREKAGVKVVHIGSSPLDALPLVTHLRNNAVVAMQIDRSPEGMRSREVSLLGRRWRVPEGPLRLAASSGAPILPMFARRLDFMQYEAILHEPIQLPKRPTDAQLDDAAQRLMNAFGAFLIKNPTQWFDFSG